MIGKPLFMLFFYLFCSANGFASPPKPKPNSANKTSQPVKPTAGEEKKFILPGHSILDSVHGDINGDAIGDLILILKVDSEETLPLEKQVNRPMLLLTRDKSGALTLAARNDRIIMCRRCSPYPDDEEGPYIETTIKRGQITVVHAYDTRGRGSDVKSMLTVRYAKQSKSWKVVKQTEIVTEYVGGKSITSKSTEKHNVAFQKFEPLY